MTLAASSSTSILAGLAVLSIGLLAMSVWLLVVTTTQKRATRYMAKKTYAEVSRVVASTLGPEGNLAQLAASFEELLSDLRRATSREDFKRRVGLARERLGVEQVRIREMWPAYNSALSLSIDELGFLDAHRESEIAALIAYYRAASELDRETSRLHETWNF